MPGKIRKFMPFPEESERNSSTGARTQVLKCKSSKLPNTQKRLLSSINMEYIPTAYDLKLSISKVSKNIAGLPKSKLPHHPSFIYLIYPLSIIPCF